MGGTKKLWIYKFNLVCGEFCKYIKVLRGWEVDQFEKLGPFEGGGSWDPLRGGELGPFEGGGGNWDFLRGSWDPLGGGGS